MTIWLARLASTCPINCPMNNKCFMPGQKVHYQDRLKPKLGRMGKANKGVNSTRMNADRFTKPLSKARHESIQKALLETSTKPDTGIKTKAQWCKPCHSGPHPTALFAQLHSTVPDKREVSDPREPEPQGPNLATGETKPPIIVETVHDEPATPIPASDCSVIEMFPNTSTDSDSDSSVGSLPNLINPPATYDSDFSDSDSNSSVGSLPDLIQRPGMCDSDSE